MQRRKGLQTLQPLLTLGRRNQTLRRGLQFGPLHGTQLRRISGRSALLQGPQNRSLRSGIDAKTPRLGVQLLLARRVERSGSAHDARHEYAVLLAGLLLAIIAAL